MNDMISKTYIYDKVAAATNSSPNLGEDSRYSIRRKATIVFCTLFSVLLISSCTNDEIISATDDALALMPAETRVEIQAEITDNRSTMTRAEGDEDAATAYYAVDEIHPDKEVFLGMEMPGGNGKTHMQGNSIPFNTLATTEPFSTLRLKDFNLTEGSDRCVSRWTVLSANYNGLDELKGWTRLTAGDNGQPVLDYGAMQRAKAKVTIIVQDEQGTAVDVSASRVSANLSLPMTLSDVIYTPEGETVGTDFIYYLNAITTLAADEAIKPESIGIATYAYGSTGNSDYPLKAMVTADDTYYYGEQDNTLTAIVPATATHTTNFITFTPIEGGAKFDGSEKLTITVNTDPDGDGPQTTGTYSLKLSDVKLSDTEYLTALKPGEHYILTITLRHNTLVTATATIGPWDEASASATLEGDGAKLPSYTYDEETNTYTVLGEAGIAEALADRAANHPDAAIVSVSPEIAIVDGAETDLPAEGAADVAAADASADEAARTWCDKTWKSITISNNE